jgi:16S rRNA G966 N2-methylase RsmD
MTKKSSAHQPSLYAKPVPTMSDGYYSSGPNPNLRRFVEEHATPYDPATDEYNVPPFDQPISTTKATAIYNMHTYWSKKPHDAIRQYIRHYTQPGDLVLDPFCGSGGTALAALMEGRKAIAIDLSPAATFITKNYCTPVDVNELQRAFAELERQVKPEMEWLYETRCDRCDGRAQTAYTVYSQVFRCARCLQEVPLFDCIEIEGQTATGKPKKVTVCPCCYERGIEEEISTRSNEKLGAVPVLVSYECQEGCKPKREQRRYNDPDPKKRRFFQEYDLGKLVEIEAKTIPYWIPPHRMMNIESETEPWGDKWRAGTSNFRTVIELFTKRNLWALALLAKNIQLIRCESDATRDQLRLAFSGTILNVSRMLKQSEQWGGALQMGTYYLPQISRESPVPIGFDYKFRDVKRGSEVLSHRDGTPTVIVSTQSATHLSDIFSESVDYIFTDPPYADKVQYGELNFIWEAWLDFDTHWHEQEIIVNETRHKGEDDWARRIRQAMSECYRVLKPGRWISLCYHDTSEGTWQLVQDIMTEAGFIPESAENALYIDTGQKSYNQLMAEKVTKRDLVINFRKPRPGEVAQLTLLGDEDQTTFKEKAQAILSEALQVHPGATADRLYDILVSRMVRRGEFERHNFETLLNTVAEPVKEPIMANLFEKKQPDLFGGHELVRWYLRATADEIDEAESAKESAAAQRLERYMTSYLTEHPEESGVHYSDLFEQYLQVKDKPRRLLQEWLTEFFFKTDAGTWRPPLSEEERAQKALLRESGALRRIKRFARALLEGVPPAPHDHPANAATAADWIRQCRRAGLYDLGRALYEKGGFTFNALSEEAQLEVEEDYQVCVRRS